VLIARLSTYESTSLSMAQSLLAQIAQEMPNVFADLTFLPDNCSQHLGASWGDGGSRKAVQNVSASDGPMPRREPSGR
jgi:hypothetical protein